MEKVKILVSACLLGEACRYDGKDNKIASLSPFYEDFDWIPICPEVLGGLPIPRCPAEIQKKKVINQEGEDVSIFFEKGAKKSLDLAKQHQVKFALLKAKSPSCGFGLIYDGSFSRTLVSGNGWTADLLSQEGIQIFTELELDKFLKEVYNKNTIE